MFTFPSQCSAACSTNEEDRQGLEGETAGSRANATFNSTPPSLLGFGPIRLRKSRRSLPWQDECHGGGATGGGLKTWVGRGERGGTGGEDCKKGQTPPRAALTGEFTQCTGLCLIINVCNVGKINKLHCGHYSLLDVNISISLRTTVTMCESGLRTAERL